MAFSEAQAEEFFRAYARALREQDANNIKAVQEAMAKKSPDFSWLPRKGVSLKTAFFDPSDKWAVSINYNMMPETSLWFNHPTNGWRQTECGVLRYRDDTVAFHKDGNALLEHMLDLEKRLQDVPTREKAEAEAMAYLASREKARAEAMAYLA